jgi:perosamine synthetase
MQAGHSTAQQPAAAGSLLARGRQWPWYDAAAVERCRELIAEGRSFDYYEGPELSTLEEGFALRCMRKRALAFNSGTSALLAAYVAIGVEPGDEVLVPTFTFLSTASPLFLLGAVPVLCDSGDQYGNVTADSIERRITPKTRAIVVTHLWGEPCDMTPILALARSRNLPVIADCSHAHGSTYDDQDIGHFGDMAVFSLGSHKIVSGGLGGILLCDEDLYFDVACLLGHFKQRARGTVTTLARARFADIGLGANLRMSPIAAVLAHSHLSTLDEIMRTKSSNVEALISSLSQLDGIDTLPQRPGVSREGWYGCVLRAHDGRTRRDEFLIRLEGVGVPVTAPPTGLLHRTSVFTGHRPSEKQLANRVRLPLDRTYTLGDLPTSEALFDSWLALPTTYLHGEQDELLAACVNGVERLVQ